MTDNKTIAKNTIIIYIRIFLSAIIGVFSSRLILRALGADDYGLYSVVGSIVVFVVFFNTVMVATTYRYLAFEIGKGGRGDLNKVFNVSLSIHICLALIALFVALTLGLFYINNYLNVDQTRLSDANIVFLYSVISCVFSIVSVPFQGLITAYEKFSVLAVIEICRQLLILIVSLLLFIECGNKLRFYAALMGAVVVLTSLLYIFYCVRKYKHIVKWKLQRDSALYMDMMAFSWWTAFGAAASVGQQQGTTIIINHFFGTIVNAAYGISLIVQNVINHFSRSIAQSAAPQITKSFSNDDKQRSIYLASYISKYSAFLILIFSVPFLIETNYIIIFWLGEDAVPPYTIILCRLIVISLFIRGMDEGLTTLVQATGKIKWFEIIMSLTTLFSLPLSWTLYSYGMPPQTILYCFIFTTIINLIWRQFLLYKLIRFDVARFLKLSYLRLLYVVICVLPLVHFILQFKEGLLRCIVSIPLTILYTLLVIYLVGMDFNEKKQLKMMLYRCVEKVYK